MTSALKAMIAMAIGGAGSSWGSRSAGEPSKPRGHAALRAKRKAERQRRKDGRK